MRHGSQGGGSTLIAECKGHFENVSKELTSVSKE
jgi:hypothetical protein